MFDTETWPESIDREPPPDSVAPEDLIDELDALIARREYLDARIVALLRQTTETAAHQRDGYSSVTALLKYRMSLHPGEAQRLVTRANGLGQAPLAALAYESGAISGAQVDVLLHGSFMAPEAFRAAEGSLVETALDTPLVRDLRKQVDRWVDQVAAGELADSRRTVRELRALNLRRDQEMVRVTGWMEIEAGERAIAMLDPGPPVEGDDRSAAARRADRFLELLEGGGSRTNLTIHVSAESLLHGRDGISETEYGSFLTRDEIQRLACDSNVTRVIFGPDSQPLDVGRTKRLVTPAMRKAVEARDLRCVFPTCDRPARWCDVHHLIHWVDDGETKVELLVLLCRHHHVLVHEGGWSLTGEPGDLHFFRTDGSELGVDPPPRRTRQRRIVPSWAQPRASLREHLQDWPRFRDFAGADPP